MARKQSPQQETEILQAITVEENEQLSAQQRADECGSGSKKNATASNTAVAENTEFATLSEIENELAKLAHSDNRNWIKQYKLMTRVEEEELFKPDYHSFSQWLSAFADANKIFVSALWQRKKAGKVYFNFHTREEAAGRKAPEFDSCNLAPESLVYIEKIADKNEKVADKLTRQLIKGEITRKDLKAKYETVRGHRLRAKAARTAASAAQLEGDNRYNIDSEAGAMEESAAIAASDIIVALRSAGASWIPQELYEHGSEKTVYNKPKYQLLPEFPVRTGATRNARRMDALIVEDHTVDMQERMFDLRFHAIEIKVSEYDLLGDHKMQEYGMFANYCWLAVPKELQEIAENNVLAGWGLLVVDTETSTITAAKTAKKREMESITAVATALYKML